MKAKCTHCQAEYDFPGLEALDHPVRVKCETCDQTFEVGAAPPPQEPARRDDLLEGLDDAMKEFTLDTPPRVVSEDLDKAIEEMVPEPEGKVDLEGVTVEPEEVEAERPGAGAQVAGPAPAEPAGSGAARESGAGSAAPAVAAPAVAPGVSEVRGEAPAARKVEAPAPRPEPRPAAQPAPAIAPPPAAPPAAPAPAPSAQPQKPVPPPKPEPEAAPPPKSEPGKKKPQEEEKLPPENIEDLLAEEAAPAEAAPPPVPKKAAVGKKPVKRKPGFAMPQLSPKLLIIAGGGLLVIIGIVVVLIFVLFSEGTASEQWAEALKKETIDPFTVAKVFLRACEEPDDATLSNVFYGRPAPAVEKAKVEAAGEVFDQLALGPIGQVATDKEKLLAEKKAEAASRQEKLSRYEALQKTGDPDDIMIGLTQKRRELSTVLDEKNSEIKAAGADLGRLGYDVQQLKQKIAKAQNIVDKYANPKTNLERAQKDTNIRNIEMYNEDLANKTREYNETKATADAQIAEIEARYAGQIDALQKSIEERTQELSLLESLKSDNPTPLLDLQAEVKALTQAVAALDTELQALKAEAARAQKSLARAPGARALLATGAVSRSSVEVKAAVRLKDDTEKSSVLLTRYEVEKDGKKVLGDWLVDGLK
ncbi:MAG: hypothetical protein AB1714_20465 [Acidobacteriota bacterium]